MPQIGHALVGLGLGAAATQAPRSKWVRRAWLGIVLLAALLPDVVEWYYLVLGGPLVPHSAFASVFLTILSILICSAILRFAFGETSIVAHLLVGGAILSHSLLDLIDGGIPLLWPLDSIIVGPEAFGPDDAPLLQQLRREFAVLSPFLTVGVFWGLYTAGMRGGRRRETSTTTWLFVAAGFVAIVGGLISFFAPGVELALPGLGNLGIGESLSVFGLLCAVVAVAVHVQVGWLRFALYSCIPLLPAFVLGGLEVMARIDLHRAFEIRATGDYQAAADRFDRAAGWHALSTRFFARCNAARCYWQGGEPAEAAKRFEAMIDEYGPEPTLLYHEAQFRIGTEDPAFRDVEKARDYAARAAANSRSRAVRAESRKIVERAEAVLRGE